MDLYEEFENWRTHQSMYLCRKNWSGKIIDKATEKSNLMPSSGKHPYPIKKPKCLDKEAKPVPKGSSDSQVTFRS